VTRERLLPVVLSVIIIVAVALLQERSRHLAALLAAMPLTAPLAMWIVFSASQGDYRQTADFVASMALGFVAALAFIAACWFGLRHQWGFPVVLGLGAVVWLASVVLPSLVWRWLTTLDAR
jgi:hypothetical protein